MENAEDVLFDLIEQHLGTRPEHVHQNLISDLGADSLDIVEITMAIEDRFNIVIDDSEIGGDITAQNFIDIIAAKGALQ